jgi:hypothetical protein
MHLIVFANPLENDFATSIIVESRPSDEGGGTIVASTMIERPHG